MKRSVFFDLPGTLLLDVGDPDGDDNGPGNYAYPTSDAFHPGAFDIQRFQVYDAGADVTFPARTRDLRDVREPARRAARRRLCACARRRVDVNGRIYTRCGTSDRTELRVEPPDPGAGLRPALRRPHRQHARDSDDLGEPDLPIHHVQRPESLPRHARPRLGLHGRAHRPGRFSSDQARSSRQRRSRSSSASAPPRAAIRTARSTRASCRRRWTSSAAPRARGRCSTTRSDQSCLRASRFRSA